MHNRGFNKGFGLVAATVLLLIAACNFDSNRKSTQIVDSVVATTKVEVLKKLKPIDSINGTYKQYSLKGGNWRDTIFDTHKLLEINDSLLFFLKDGKVVDFDTLTVARFKSGESRLYRKRIDRVDLRFRRHYDTLIMIDRSEPGWVAEFVRVK